MWKSCRKRESRFYRQWGNPNLFSYTFYGEKSQEGFMAIFEMIGKIGLYWVGDKTRWVGNGSLNLLFKGKSVYNPLKSYP